jgi:hypothetical protein
MILQESMHFFEKVCVIVEKNPLHLFGASNLKVGHGFFFPLGSSIFAVISSNQKATRMGPISQHLRLLTRGSRRQRSSIRFFSLRKISRFHSHKSG